MRICPKCGAQSPDEYNFCGQCAAPLPAKEVGPEAVAPPVAPAAPEVPQSSVLPVAPPLGSLGTRLVAHLIDLVFLVLAFWLTGNAYGALLGGLTPSGFNLTGLPALIIIGVACLGFFIYLVVFEGLVGATPGKFLLGLRVRTVEGAPCKFSQAAVRNILRIVDAIAVYLVALVVALISKKKQRIGDLAARTIVVQEAPGAAKRVGAVLFLLVCLVGTILASLYVRHHSRVPILTFGIANLRLADSDTAPPRTSAEYKPEEEVRIFYEVPGYELDKDSYIAVITRNQVLAPDGKPFFETKTIEVRQKAGDDSGPVKCNFHITLPPWAPPGQYTISIQAEDQIAHKTEAAAVVFTVKAPPVETSATLVAKNIELANSSDGATLSPPVFTPGQSIWLRFRVLGVKANEQGQVRLTEDWGVIGPDGKPLFEQSDTSLVNEQYVYPPPFVPVTDHVSTPSSLEPGEYKFHVVLHDKMSGADFTLDQPFTITKP
ncbi:MAG: RDD family protein [Terriglobia bacterium]